MIVGMSGHDEDMNCDKPAEARDSEVLVVGNLSDEVVSAIQNAEYAAEPI